MRVLSPKELSALERDVVLAAEQHEQESHRSNGKYSRLFDHDIFKVKYNDHVVIERECEALRRLYDLAIKDGTTAPHVPRVVHYFYGPNGLGYIIMERINVCTVPKEEFYRQAAKAVLWLRAKHMDLFGSLGGANPSHTVFQGGIAPKPFTSLHAAQIYLNVAVDRVRQRQQSWMTLIANINLMGDNVVLTQSDMHPSNFGVAPDGRPVIFDAATIQALPETLADFTLLKTTDFARAVSAYVFNPVEMEVLLASANFTSLAEVRIYLSRGDDNLGVDMNGNVRSTRRTHSYM